MAPTFGQPTLAAIISGIEANLSTSSKLDLSTNASICMKPTEAIGTLAEALKKNTIVTHLVLRECEIGDSAAEALGDLLRENHYIEELDLQQNKIATAGVIALGRGLKQNRGVRSLNLLKQSSPSLGEEILEEFKEMFGTNLTLTKIMWQFQSRQSWQFTKPITRNIEIWRRVAAGREFTDLLPDHLRELEVDLTVPAPLRAPLPAPPVGSKPCVKTPEAAAGGACSAAPVTSSMGTTQTLADLRKSFQAGENGHVPRPPSPPKGSERKATPLSPAAASLSRVSSGKAASSSGSIGDVRPVEEALKLLRGETATEPTGIVGDVRRDEEALAFLRSEVAPEALEEKAAAGSELPVVAVGA